MSYTAHELTKVTNCGRCGGVVKTSTDMPAKTTAKTKDSHFGAPSTVTKNSTHIYKMIVEEHNKGCGGTKQKFINKLAAAISKTSNINGRMSLANCVGNQDRTGCAQFTSLCVPLSCCRRLLSNVLSQNDWFKLAVDSFLITLAAAGSNCIWSVEALLDAKADPALLFQGLSCVSWAAQNGALASVSALIDRGADPNCGNEPPLTLAAAYGHANVAQILIDGGADVHAARSKHHSEYPPTALYAACQLGNAEVCKVLLNANADIDQGRMDGDEIICTPLWMSCWAGHASCVRLLITHDADLNIPFAVAPYSDTCPLPLAAATSRGHKDVVRLLVRKKETVLSPSLPHSGSLQNMPTGGGICRSGLTGRSTIENNHIDSDADSTAEYLARKTCDSCGIICSKMMKCSRCETVHFCSLQCQKEAWPTHRLECTNSSDVDEFHEFLSDISEGAYTDDEHFFDVDEGTDSDGPGGTNERQSDILDAALSALSANASHDTAAFSTATKTATTLLSNIMSNPTEEKYRTIHVTNQVIQRKLLSHNGACQFLLAAGFVKIDDTFVFLSDDTAPIAAGLACLDQARTLLSAISSTSVALHSAIQRGDIASMEHLLVQGAGVNFENENLETPLIALLLNSNQFQSHRLASIEGIVQQLIAAKADVNAKSTHRRLWYHQQALENQVRMADKPSPPWYKRMVGGHKSKPLQITQGADGDTPLMILCSRMYRTPGLENMIKSLLQAGAETNVQCRTSGFSALLLTVLAETNGLVAGANGRVTASRDRIMKSLLQHKASVDVQEVMGMTALTCAAFSGLIRPVQMLLHAGADCRLCDIGGITAERVAHQSVKEMIQNPISDASAAVLFAEIEAAGQARAAQSSEKKGEQKKKATKKRTDRWPLNQSTTQKAETAATTEAFASDLHLSGQQITSNQAISSFERNSNALFASFGIKNKAELMKFVQDPNNRTEMMDRMGF